MGGIETHVYEVSRRLVDRGCRVTVLTTDRGGERPGREMVHGAEVIRVPAWPKQRDYYVAPEIYQHILSSKTDLVHVQGYHTFVPPVAMAAAMRRRLPYVVTFHSGGHSSKLRNALRWPQHRTLAPFIRGAAHLIGVSQFEADFFRERMGVSRRRFSVIRNGAQMPETIAAPATVKTRPLIISMGRLERYKGHQRLISALPSLLDQNPEIQVRILGEGPYKPELIALAARLGVADHVKVGGIPPADRTAMANLLSGASLVVLLSDYEAHPVMVMEALALGRRVLVTDCTGLSEMVDHDAVESVPLQATPEQIARAVLTQMAKGAMRRAPALPTWDDCADQLADVYRNVLHCAGESQ
jgi:glycosyltransferase involved in cell wall biosynthesis